MKAAYMMQKQWTGRTILFALIGFFAVIFAVNGVFAYLALLTNSGLDTAESYRKGLQYNARIQASDAQARLGWQAEVSIAPDRGSIDLVVTDDAGQPVTGLLVKGSLGRPATDRFDRNLVLHEVKPGVYETRIVAPEPGTWAIALDGIRGGDQPIYQLRRRLWLAPTK